MISHLSGETVATPTRREWQVLRLAVEVSSSAPEVLDATDFLVNDARQPEPAAERLSFSIEPRAHDYEVTVGGSVIDRAPDLHGVIDTLFANIQARALALYPRHALVRGAVLRDGDKRVLLVGEPRCGLTTLAVRMLYSGSQVEGDAFALLGGDGLMPIPRRFVLREGAATVLPELADSLAGLPTATSGLGVIWGFDPARAGFEWEIRRGPIDACVAIEASHGGASRILPATVTDMARRLVARCSPPPAGGSAWLREAVELVSGAACARLVLGRLEDAVPMLDAWVRAGHSDIDWRPNRGI